MLALQGFRFFHVSRFFRRNKEISLVCFAVSVVHPVPHHHWSAGRRRSAQRWADVTVRVVYGPLRRESVDLVVEATTVETPAP